MGYRGHNRSRGGNNHFPGSNSFNSRVNDYNDNNKIWVEIQGWMNASKDELVQFISRKTNISLKEAYVEGNTVRAAVLTQKEADYLKNFSGTKFARDTLRITVLSDKSTLTTLSILRGFLQRRFLMDQKILDLTNMAGDSELAATGLFNISFAKMFTALMKVAEEEPFASGIETLIVSENGVQNGNDIGSIAQTFPFLKNLSLTNNKITALKSLENFRHKLNSLKALAIDGNPIITNSNYVLEMMRLFPRVEMIDNHRVRDELKLAEIWKFPLSRQQFFFEDGGIQQLTGEFLTSFLNLWDNDRLQLSSLYTPDSQFSVSIDSAAPTILGANDVGSWDYYIPNSRNLTRIAGPSSNTKLSKGQEQIISMFKSLPKTKHEQQQHPEKFSIESWKVNETSIMIALHGEFAEVGPPEQSKKPVRKGFQGNRHNNNNAKTLSKRSFDRTWFIVSANSSYVIASDLLVIRPYAGNLPWIPGAVVAAAASTVPIAAPIAPIAPGIAPVIAAAPGIAAASSVVLPPEVSSVLNDVQKDILVKIIAQTNLNISYAGMLAEQSNWDLQGALENFKKSSGNIPPDAFN